MKKLLLFSIFLGFLLSGCTEDSPVDFKNENFSEKDLESCRNLGCPEISVSYVLAEGKDERAAAINAVVNSLIADVLYLGDETQAPNAENVKEAAKSFISMFRTHSAEFPDMQVEYFAELNIGVSYLGPELISLEMNYYLFTGGAHGYGGTKYVNFDGETGLRYDSPDLFNDLDGLISRSEEAFREKYGIPANANINSTGFSFEEERFHLPETIGFSADSLLLNYNPYEIASYATGPVSLNIPLKEVSSYITIPLK